MKKSALAYLGLGFVLALLVVVFLPTSKALAAGGSKIKYRYILQNLGGGNCSCVATPDGDKNQDECNNDLVIARQPGGECYQTPPQQCPQKDSYLAYSFCEYYPAIDHKLESITRFTLDPASLYPNCKYQACQTTYNYNVDYDILDKKTGAVLSSGTIRSSPGNICSLLESYSVSGTYNISIKSVNELGGGETCNWQTNGVKSTDTKTPLPTNILIPQPTQPTVQTNTPVLSQPVSQPAVTQPAAPVPAPTINTDSGTNPPTKGKPSPALVDASNAMGLLFNRLFSW